MVFNYEEALHTADNIMTFKLAIKTIAKKHGLCATFMPKPKYGVCGSGMHMNMSLSKDGKNIFADDNDKLGLSQEAYYFIAGIMEHMREMTASRCNVFRTESVSPALWQAEVLPAR